MHRVDLPRVVLLRAAVVRARNRPHPSPNPYPNPDPDINPDPTRRQKTGRETRLRRFLFYYLSRCADHNSRTAKHDSASSLLTLAGCENFLERLNLPGKFPCLRSRF